MLNATVSRVAPWLCAAVLAGGAAAPAWAGVNAAASLYDFGWSLVDLNPGDGIAPGVTFSDTGFTTRASLKLQESYVGADGQPLPEPSEVVREWNGRGRPFPYQSLEGYQGTVRGESRQQSSGSSIYMLTGGRVTQRADDGVYASSFETELVAAHSVRPATVVLAPYTELVWSGRVLLIAGRSAAEGARRGQYASSDVSMRMLGDDGSELAGYSAHLDTHGLFGERSISEVVRISLSNAGSGSLSSTLEMSMRTSGYAAMSPVPEPGAVGLMLAGMGVVGVAARRGRRGHGSQAARA